MSTLSGSRLSANLAQPEEMQNHGWLSHSPWALVLPVFLIRAARAIVAVTVQNADGNTPRRLKGNGAGEVGSNVRIQSTVFQKGSGGCVG